MNKRMSLAGRPKQLHEQISRIHSFERGRYIEFEELCRENKVSVSQALRTLIEGELQKKELGSENNPIGVSYIYNKPETQKPFQSDLLPWLDVVAQVQEHKELSKLKGQALEIARRVDRRSMELRKQGIKQ